MKPFFSFLWFVLQRFLQNDNRKAAAELTFMSLFALVPLMTSTYMALTALPMFDEIADELQGFIFSHFVPASGEVVQEYLVSFAEQARKLTFVGLLILFVSAISLLHGLEEAFNKIWRVKTKRLGRRVVLYWLVMFLTPVALALFFLIGSYVMSSNIWLDHVDGYLNVNTALISALPWLLSIMILTTLYYLIPASKVYFWQALVGAVIATAILDVSQWVFVSIVASMPNYKVIYGAFAAVPLFLMWLFLVWIIILLVAEIIRALPYIKQDKHSGNRSDLDWALQILTDLYSSKQVNQQVYAGNLTLTELEALERNLNYLIDAQWVDNQDGDLLLLADLDEKTVSQLSDIVHAKQLSGIALKRKNSPWYDTLNPLFLKLKQEKSGLLNVPVSSVIGGQTLN
ncbi:YihY family inner membrane protein [Bermanella sp. R86510]|uniref:YihY family inner membrane protein n=1 Tax=unclassified Bermanella TaxID=2627862 RepID=UPI0037C50E5F